jgi:hypothetical protein
MRQAVIRPVLPQFVEAVVPRCDRYDAGAVGLGTGNIAGRIPTLPHQYSPMFRQYRTIRVALCRCSLSRHSTVAALSLYCTPCRQHSWLQANPTRDAAIPEFPAGGLSQDPGDIEMVGEVLKAGLLPNLVSYNNVFRIVLEEGKEVWRMCSDQYLHRWCVAPSFSG